MTVNCTTSARDAGEPLAGTAPLANCWILIEQPGPWGKQALLDSHLDPELGQVLKDRADGTGVSVLLVRHPDRLEHAGFGATRNVWVIQPAPGATRMRRGTMSDLSAITRWDFQALAAGALPPFGESTLEPLLLVCTHSGRDTCCAVHGRALFTAVLETVTGADRQLIWESSHIGGHRFAPTVLSLPSGAVFGRLTPTEALEVFTKSRQLMLTIHNYRGRSCFSQPLQVAEILVREAARIYERDALDVLRVIDGHAIAMPTMSDPGSAVIAEVRHADGRAWHVNLRRERLTQLRAQSCGAEPTPAEIWRSVGIAEIAPWRSAGN